MSASLPPERSEWSEHSEALAIVRTLASALPNLDGFVLAMLLELVTGVRASEHFRSHWYGADLPIRDDGELREILTALRRMATQRRTEFAREVTSISGAMLDDQRRASMARFALPEEKHRVARGKGRFEHLRRGMLGAAEYALAEIGAGKPIAQVAHAVATKIYPFVETHIAGDLVGNAIERNRSDRESLAVALLELAPQWRNGAGYDAILNASQKKKSSRS